MECDKIFDCVITTDGESIKKFKYFEEIKKLMLLTDAVKAKDSICELYKRKIVYNLGLATTDIYKGYLEVSEI